jgi:hypothetical protein
VKIEPKPEPKIEPKPKPEPKMEPKVESKPVPKVESKPAPKIEPKIATKLEPEAQEKALTGIANDVNLLFDKYRDRLTKFIAKMVKRNYSVFAPDLFGMYLPGELDALLKKYGATIETLE